MVKAIVGANWGDEGKGKITDMLAESSDVVIRFQGGANAGHTIINDYGRFALHILPSGTFYPHITNIIGNGVALDIRKLVENALLTSASAVILAHNHPSGVALPSPEDYATTDRAKQALATVGIPLTDHIIVADQDFVSFADSGYLS